MVNTALILVALVVLLGILLGILPIVLKQLKRSGTSSEAKLPYRKNDDFLSAAERSFFEVLRSITGDQLEIFAKVRLLDLVYLPQGTENRQSHVNRVMSKHVDFVLCDRQNVSPVLVIELDDSSHDRADRVERDAFVDEVLRSAGLPLLRVTAKRAYSPKELTDLIEEKLAAKTA